MRRINLSRQAEFAGLRTDEASAESAGVGLPTPKTRVDKEESVLYNLIVLQPAGYGMMTSNQMDATFAALADSTRRAILLRLATGQASVNELAKPFRMSQPAVSKHLKVLERAGLISVGQDAQRRPRRIQAARLAEASAWLERFREFWEGSFCRLDDLLEEMKSSEHAAKRRGHRRKGS